MKKKRVIQSIVLITVLIILSVNQPTLTADKEKELYQETNSFFKSENTYILCKINTTGNGTASGSFSSMPGIGGDIKLFGSTVLTHVKYDQKDSFGNTTIKPFFGLSTDTIHINGSYQLIIWCLWGDYSVPALGAGVGPVYLEGIAIYVRIIN